MKNLHVITNDKLWISKRFYTSNNDLNNIISCLHNKYKINLICRKNSKKLNFLIDKKINLCNLNDIEEKHINILLISISPFNFFALFYLSFIKNIKIKGFVYLRSDGFLEYKFRFGILGYLFYFIMFNFIKKKVTILSCSKNFTKVKISKILHPSELTAKWFRKKKKLIKKNIDFLYIGRFKKDKGVLFLSKFLKDNFIKYKVKIVGTKKKDINKKFFSNNIEYLAPISSEEKLIDLYDSAKIFILPSYIEGFPKVISEALARDLPIIIFEDIKYVINGRYGIFTCKRNIKSFKNKVDYIFENYDEIQKRIKKNYFFTKKNFKREFLNSIKNGFKQ